LSRRVFPIEVWDAVEMIVNYQLLIIEKQQQMAQNIV